MDLRSEMQDTAQTDEKGDEEHMPKVITVLAVGKEEVLIYPECPYAEFYHEKGNQSVVQCSRPVQGFHYCTAMRMEPSLCPLDVVGQCSR